MITGIFHLGSGLGNQLHRYVATRVLAEDKGYDFSMVAPENFKGKSFMNLDMGVKGSFITAMDYPTGRVSAFSPDFTSWEEKTNYYNPEFNFIEDGTIIDGEFQDERYFSHRLHEIDDWLNVQPILWPIEKYGKTFWEIDAPDDVCVIGFRGGEFYVYPELGLPPEYFKKGIEMMKEINPNMRFEVHTDDEVLAKKFFPEYKVIHDIGINWRSMRYAKYAIIANSSFYIFPRLLSKGITIAPRWWARHNTREWSRPDNYYKSFTYIHV